MEDQVTNIQNGMKNLDSAVSAMGSVWTGTAAGETLGRAKSAADSLEQVEKFIDFLGDHIDQCRMNYNFAEQVNAQILKSISELFL